MDKVASEEISTTGGDHADGVGNENGSPNRKEGSADPSIILVTGLSDEISGRDLKKFLRPFGRIGKIKLMMIKTSVPSTGKLENRRFAHVTVPSGNSAHHLVRKINQVDCNLKGCRLQVTRAPESGPMSVNYADSSVPTSSTNGDKSAKPADPSSLNGENDRGLLYSDQSSHNTPSPSPTPTPRTSGATRNKLQSISDGEIETDEYTDELVSSSNQRQEKRKVSRQRRSDSNLSGGGGRKAVPEDRCDRPRNRRPCFSVRRAISRQGESRGSPREQSRKRFREESASPQRRARPRMNSMDGLDDGEYNDRGRRGRSVAPGTRKEEVKKSHSQSHPRDGILTYEQIKEMQRERDRERRRQKQELDGKSQDRGMPTTGSKRCCSSESRALRELQRLERAHQKLKEEREKMEMEKLELVFMQREQQRMEMEEIEREKERVRRARQNLLLKEQAWKTKTSRFGSTIAEQVIEEIRQKERSQEEIVTPFSFGRSRSGSSPSPRSLSRPRRRRRSPERKEGRFSHKPNYNWEDDDDYSPRKGKPSRFSVRSPEILSQGIPQGDGSLHRDRDHHHGKMLPVSASSSSNSLGYSSSFGCSRKDSGKDAVDEFLGKIGARAMTHGRGGSGQWNNGETSDSGIGTVRSTVGTSASEAVSVNRPSSQNNTFIDLLGNPYTITALSERGTGGGSGPGIPRGGKLSDAIANLYDNQGANGTRRNRGEGAGGRGSDGGSLFVHENRYKSDFQRYYHQN